MTGSHRRGVVGDPDGSFWLYDSLTGYDLTHPITPDTPTIDNAIRIETTTLPITIDPAKSAIVIIDMQNFFLSTALGRSSDSKGLKAQKNLLHYAIPAARKAGIRIVWLNWGLTEAEIRQMPAAAHRSFGFGTVEAPSFDSLLQTETQRNASHADASLSKLDKAVVDVETFGKSRAVYHGLGKEMGLVTLEDGSTVDAGRQLMRDQWNTALTPELSQAYQEGLKMEAADVWCHKNRISGMWGASTPCTEYLDREGIKTLFFAGVNTDQCVGGSMVDAFSKGYDCILLSDGAATSSPDSCQQAYEYNATSLYGFCMSCRSLSDGVEAQLR